MDDKEFFQFDEKYDGPLSEPVPALVNAVLLSIAQAYIPQLRALDADACAERMWSGEPRLIFVPPEELAGAQGFTPGAEGHVLALGTVAFGVSGADRPGDEYRIFLNVIPYSEQNIGIALETDALAHAMGVHDAGELEPAKTYSLWFAAGAPPEKTGSPDMYVIGPDHLDEAEEIPDDPSQAVTLIAYTGEWPPEGVQEHAHKFWDFLSEIADHVVVSLRD